MQAKGSVTQPHWVVNTLQSCKCFVGKGGGVGGSVPCDASVGGHDEDRGEVALQGAVQEGEALHVEHVDLIYEQHLKAWGRGDTSS